MLRRGCVEIIPLSVLFYDNFWTCVTIFLWSISTYSSLLCLATAQYESLNLSVIIYNNQLKLPLWFNQSLTIVYYYNAVSPNLLAVLAHVCTPARPWWCKIRFSSVNHNFTSHASHYFCLPFPFIFASPSSLASPQLAVSQQSIGTHHALIAAYPRIIKFFLL